MTHKKYLFHAARTPKLYCCLHYTSIFQFGRERFTDEPLSNGERVKKPLKSDDFRGFWSEWGDSNSRHLAPKASALPTALHPVMKFSNCGQTCGQRRFLTSYRRGGKCCQPKCPKAFRDFRELCLEPEPHAPKPPALPTALIPDIRFSA